MLARHPKVQFSWQHGHEASSISQITTGNHNSFSIRTLWHECFESLMHMVPAIQGIVSGMSGDGIFA